jgi:UDP-3-O-[3-hydroxymyristoyl] glucosamine N-acyltransferase
MKLAVLEIAKIVSGEFIGDKNIILTGVNSLLNAKKNDISFFGNMKYFNDALKTEAGVILIGYDINISKFANKNIIKVKNPQYAYSIILSIIEDERKKNINNEIHKLSCIFKNVKLGINLYIGQNVVVEKMSEIGDDTKIFPNVFVGNNVKIGNNCLIYPNVVIRENTFIGDRVIIHSGVVIGSDGFGFINVNSKIHKIPQIGNVIIGNDVEIGANTTIDRATVNSTVIGDSTKIDNLVQIAHNVKIGRNCMIVAQVGIAGSTIIGDNVVIGGQTGIVGHIKIGNNVIISSQSGISRNVKDGEKIGGNPISSIKKSIKIRALIRKLPEIYSDLKKIKDKYNKNL